MDTMYKYYEVVAQLGTDRSKEILFGSFDRTDCVEELKAERASWKAEGFNGFKVISRQTAECPDPAIYS